MKPSAFFVLVECMTESVREVLEYLGYHRKTGLTPAEVERVIQELTRVNA